MYQIFLSGHFAREIKGFVKKHPNILAEIGVALSAFDKASATSLGANTYKMRIGSKSAGHGKSGAFRMVILLIEVDSIIAPLAFYAKADRANISRQEILYHIEMVKREL
ncbi:MAG: type II toxin-antitoxin system RelE/ParE family toxin [Candidatus Uhrbacteria bacterium]|nr:type II toxin-antitoxin system RelE/ParE family toxin [Candidatus Uhrbacteria bacterium]